MYVSYAQNGWMDGAVRMYYHSSYLLHGLPERCAGREQPSRRLAARHWSGLAAGRRRSRMWEIPTGSVGSCGLRLAGKPPAAAGEGKKGQAARAKGSKGMIRSRAGASDRPSMCGIIPPSHAEHHCASSIKAAAAAASFRGEAVAGAVYSVFLYVNASWGLKQ